MGHKLRYWCVTAYNKEDLKKAQERGLNKQLSRAKRGRPFKNPDSTAKRFEGQHEEHFIDKPAAVTRQQKLKKKFDVVRLRKCREK